jgi:hypothetical protein
MVRFVLKLIAFLAPLALVACGIFLLEGGYSDAFYLRFTSTRQESMIIGTSRAAQGLVPSVINRQVKTYQDPEIYNFAFTVSHSPYGKAYLDAIKRKISSDGPGFFLLSIDPWSLAEEGEDPDDESVFAERNGFLASISDPSSNPNVEYMLRFYSEPYYNILFRRIRTNHMKVHSDGWLEVLVKVDSISLQKRLKKKLKVYERNATTYKFSNTRLRYLNETITFLQEHGDVYLVRMPVHTAILEIERKFLPGFDSLANSLSVKHNVPYLDLTTEADRYVYTDGNHLHKESSKLVSRKVAAWIDSVHVLTYNDHLTRD